MKVNSRLFCSASNTIIAGVNTSMANGSLIDGGDSITIVVDNLFPTAPGIGPGVFTLDTTAAILTTSGVVRIFTAKRSQNLINGTIQTLSFTPGPLFVDSATEIWGVYFPSAVGGTPFTIFYKDNQVVVITPEGKIIPVQDGLELYGQDPFLALSEMYRDLHPYDEYIERALTLEVFYDREAYRERYPPINIQSSYDYIPDETYFLRRRTHKHQYFYLDKPSTTQISQGL